RRLSGPARVDGRLGVPRGDSAPFIVAGIDAATGAMLARNAWNVDFGGRVGFVDLGGAQTAWTGDRTEFLGRNGTLEQPAGLERGVRLSGRVGAALDPCGALQAVIELRAGGRAELVFLLGEEASPDEAAALSAGCAAAHPG